MREYCGVIKNIGPNTYEKLTVTVFCDRPDGDTYWIKAYPIYNLQPGEEASVYYYPPKEYQTYIRIIEVK